MKYKNNLIIECTEKELYNLWFDSRSIHKQTFDQYKQIAINNGCNVIDRFIETDTSVAQ